VAPLGLLGIHSSSAKGCELPVVTVAGHSLVTGLAFVTVGKLPWIRLDGLVSMSF
jgi:hypothetical protein